MTRRTCSGCEELDRVDALTRDLHHTLVDQPLHAFNLSNEMLVEHETCVEPIDAVPLGGPGGPRTQLRPDTYLEWSNSEINTTGRNDVPAEPVRIEVRRWLRSGGLRDGGLRRRERCLRGRIYWRDLRSCRGSMIYPAFTFSLSFYAGRLDTFLCMEIHRSYEKASNGS